MGVAKSPSVTITRMFSLMVVVTIMLVVACDKPEEDLAQEGVATNTPVPTTVTAPFQVPEGAPVPPPEGWQTVRWLNVTVASPPKSFGVDVLADVYYGSDHTELPALLISADGRREESLVAIDASDGAVLHDAVQDKDRQVIDEVLATVRISELDVATAPWPVGRGPEPTERRSLRNITYLMPDPASGFHIYTAIGEPTLDADLESFCGEAVGVRNGRSWMSISACDGTVLGSPPIADQDAVAFERFRKSVQVVQP